MKRLLSFLLFAGVVTAAFAQSPYQYLSPLPGSKYHNPEATIIVRHGDFINPATVSADAFVVTGSESGVAAGEAVLSTDRKTVIFKPADVFRFGETVTVEILGGVETLAGEALAPFTFEFEILEQAVKEAQLAARAVPFPEEDGYCFDCDELNRPDLLDSIPEFLVDTVNLTKAYGGTIMTLHRNSVLPPEGYSGWVVYYNNNGDTVKAMDIGVSVGEFTMQKNGLVTWGVPVGPGTGGHQDAVFMVADTALNVLDTVGMGNGYMADYHDCQILSNGHTVLMAYPVLTIDLSDSMEGGSATAHVYMDLVQELDAEENVIFQWRSWDHYPVVGLHDRFGPAGGSHLHVNSVEADHDGNIIISARRTSSLVKIDRNTGEVMWNLGGDMNEWTFVGEDATWDPFYPQTQHDLRVLPNGNYTFFDNGDVNRRDWARGVEYEIDEENKIATLVWEYVHPDSFLAPCTGSVQTLPNGNKFICWGCAAWDEANPSITEVIPETNEVVLEGRFSHALDPYRARKFPIYSGQPVFSVMEEVLEGNGFDFETVTDTVGIHVTTTTLPDSVGGYIFVTGTREDYAPVNPDFLGESPLVDKHRLFLEVSPSGSVDFDVALKLDYWSDVWDPTTSVVYMRETPGEGVFTPLATTHNTVNNTLDFNTTALGEFIVGRPDPSTTIYGPQLYLPKDGADVNAENDVRLWWAPIGRVNDQYTVQVSTTTDFTSPLYEANVQGAIDSVSGLTADVEYYWRVQAENVAGVAWSDTFSFTPTAPYVNLISPNGGENIGVDTAYFYIEWEDNLDDLMHITLWKDGAFYAEIDSSVESPGNKYTWEPDNSIPSGSYVVRVESAEDPTLFDESDATFTGADERNDLPTTYSLEQNYPNPFNPTTTIEFSLPEATTARVAIYDMLGREVAVLADGRMTAGAHSVEFDASALSSGVYFYRLEAGSFNAVKKMALMK